MFDSLAGATAADPAPRQPLPPPPPGPPRHHQLREPAGVFDPDDGQRAHVPLAERPEPCRTPPGSNPRSLGSARQASRSSPCSCTPPACLPLRQSRRRRRRRRRARAAEAAPPPPSAAPGASRRSNRDEKIRTNASTRAIYFATLAQTQLAHQTRVQPRRERPQVAAPGERGEGRFAHRVDAPTASLEHRRSVRARAAPVLIQPRTGRLCEIRLIRLSDNIRLIRSPTIPTHPRRRSRRGTISGARGVDTGAPARGRSSGIPTRPQIPPYFVQSRRVSRRPRERSLRPSVAILLVVLVRVVLVARGAELVEPDGRPAAAAAAARRAVVHRGETGREDDDDDDAAVASRLDAGESLRSGGGVSGPGDDRFGATAGGLDGDSGPVSDASCPARARDCPQTTDEGAIAVGCTRLVAATFVGGFVPPTAGFGGFIATGATRLGGFRGFGSSADAGRAAALSGAGGRRARFQSPSQALPAPPLPPPPPPPPGAALSAPRPAPDGDTQRWELRRVVDVYPRQPAPGLGAEDPHPSRDGRPAPRAPSNPGCGGVGCGGVLDADAGGACRALTAAADVGLRLRPRRSKAQRRLALAPHRLEQRVRELTARVERPRRLPPPVGRRRRRAREHRRRRRATRRSRRSWHRPPASVERMGRGRQGHGRATDARETELCRAWGLDASGSGG